MFIKINPIVKKSTQLTIIEGSKAASHNEDHQDALSEDEIRRQMYARIARGNALNVVEDHARRAWHNQ